MDGAVKAFNVKLFGADMPTTSRAYFPLEVCNSIVRDVEKMIHTDSFMVELGTARGPGALIANLCGEVKRIWIDEEKVVMARIMPLQSEKGKILAMLREQGVNVQYQIKGSNTMAEKAHLEHVETGKIVEVYMVKSFTPTCLAAYIR
jgi:translation initiation factor IF-1